jgi:hypothetical protein
MTTSVTVKSTKPPIKLVSERSGITLVIDRSITTTSGGGSGTVTNVSGTAPISVTSPTTTPVISVTTGTTAGTVAAGNDARFANWNWRLEWDSENTYAIGDAVYYFGSAWYAIRINTGVTPVLGLDWQPVASSATGVLPITVASGAVSIAAATTSAAGSLSASDKLKLDGIASGASYQARMENQTYIGPAGLVGYGLGNGTYAFTPDSAALDIVGDIDLMARAQPNSWTLGADQILIGKRQAAGQHSYRLGLLSGKVKIFWSADGTTIISATSTDNVPFSTEAGWVRATLDVDNGSGYTATFYTATDSATEPTLAAWTQLGAVVTVSGAATSIFSSTSQLEFGSNLLGGGQIIGTLKQAIIRNGIGGTIVCNADFEAAQDDALTFTETSSNAASVSVTTARYFYGVPNADFVSAGTQSMTPNQTHYMPFEVTAPTVVDMFIVQGQGNSATPGTLRVGIFAADTTLQPTGSCLAQGSIPYTITTTLYNKQIDPVTLQPGVYLIASNIVSAQGATWTRGAGGISPLSGTLGSNMFASRIFASAQTMSGDYTTGPLWNSKTDGATPHLHTVFLRWKAA